MRKFRKNGARTAAFLMAVSVALGSTPSTVFAASEIEVPAQVVEQNQDEVQSVETEEVTAEEASEQVQAVEDEDITEQTTENMNEQSEDVVDEIASEAIEEVSEGDSIAAEKYLLMNIPFDEFYKNELSNDVAVDGFTSATLNKSRTKSMAGNTYHVNADGSDITGITFPVKVADGVDLSAYKQVTDDDTVEITVTNRGQTSTVEYKGKDALFENDSHAYYVLSEAPSTYKEVTVGEDGKLSFGKIVGAEAEVLSDVETTLATKSSYGDYQLSFAGDSLSKIVSDNIYSVIVSTTDGSSYAMRPLENVWRGTSGIAWTSTNNVQAVHNCPTHPAHYASLMGKSISKVTYYTSDGTYEIAVADIYVPLKVNDESSLVTVENAPVKAGKTAVSVSLPEGFEPEYKVEGLENVAVADGEMTYTATKVGNYTLTVSDKSGKYADLTAGFTLTTEDMPAAYNGDYNSPALVAAEGYSADDLSAYIKNITSVSVDGKEYAASGRGAVVIVKEDGTIDISTDPFKDAKDGYDIVVKATGYADSSFTIQKGQSIENLDIEISSVKYTYSGKEKTPSVKVKNDDVTLKKDVDYTVTYSNNLNVGMATVTIQGIGKYTGTVTKEFTIVKANITKYTLNLSRTDYAYNKLEKKPTVKVLNGTMLLKKDVDYKVSYQNNIQPGIGTVTVKGSGNYTGTIKKEIYIAPSKPSMSKFGKTDKGIVVNWSQGVGVTSYEIYRSENGKSYKKVKTITSGETTKWTDTKATINGAKYSYKIIAYKKVGSTILKSKESNVKTTYRLDTPSISSLSSKTKQMSVKWTKNKKATYYYIEYSLKSNFEDSKIIKVTGTNNVSKVINKLTPGRKYYVRVRAYKNVNGSNYCSAWSAKKSVTIKK